ncbi:MAG: serine hydrolase domain-containing protein [Pseudomonadota bacterium]|nr:serine hydrolase domain-containing protein [Pseudomonadota bacterium]
MDLATRIDAVMRMAVDSGGIPGISAVVSTAAGDLCTAACGERASGGGTPMTPDTVFWIASLSKAVTAACAMQQVEQGRLSLDAPAADVLPELDTIQVLTGFADDGSPILRAPKSRMTLRQLLTHSAGFAYNFWQEPIARYIAATGLPDIATRRRRSLHLPLLFDPGTGWEYGVGIDWAGLMVEAVTGMRLGHYMREHLCGPLGMHDTAFVPTASMQARRTSMHTPADGGGWKSSPPGIVAADTEIEMGGGGLHSTAPDYARFNRMILGRGTLDGVQVLRPETVAMMSVNQMGANRVHMLRTAAPAISADAEFFPGLEKSWGLSFMINEQPAPTGRSAGSLAWAGLPNCYHWIDPKRDIAGVFLTQTLPFARPDLMQPFLDFERAVYDSLG